MPTVKLTLVFVKAIHLPFRQPRSILMDYKYLADLSMTNNLSSAYLREIKAN